MRKIYSVFLVPFIMLQLYGCAPLIVGAAVGAAGGHALSQDTIQGETDKDYDRLYNDALTVSRIRGKVVSEDRGQGVIELEAESSKVNIRIIRLTRSTNRLRIAARKYHLPNLSLAQDIFLKIIEGVK
ncbi:MAG: hypothetical protein JW788_07465 [Candidatus Omnitrophica bacterium]|nr:hypothetical protein [Candidatus Omnitrophota bacterium]